SPRIFRSYLSLERKWGRRIITILQYFSYKILLRHRVKKISLQKKIGFHFPLMESGAKIKASEKYLKIYVTFSHPANKSRGLTPIHLNWASALRLLTQNPRTKTF